MNARPIPGTGPGLPSDSLYATRAGNVTYLQAHPPYYTTAPNFAGYGSLGMLPAPSKARVKSAAGRAVLYGLAGGVLGAVLPFFKARTGVTYGALLGAIIGYAGARARRVEDRTEELAQSLPETHEEARMRLRGMWEGLTPEMKRYIKAMAKAARAKAHTQAQAEEASVAAAVAEANVEAKMTETQSTARKFSDGDVHVQGVPNPYPGVGTGDVRIEGVPNRHPSIINARWYAARAGGGYRGI